MRGEDCDATETGLYTIDVRLEDKLLEKKGIEKHKIYKNTEVQRTFRSFHVNTEIRAIDMHCPHWPHWPVSAAPGAFHRRYWQRATSQDAPPAPLAQLSPLCVVWKRTYGPYGFLWDIGNQWDVGFSEFGRLASRRSSSSSLILSSMRMALAKRSL